MNGVYCAALSNVLLRAAGTRGTIEACFEAAKSLPPRRGGEVGLDPYAVRSPAFAGAGLDRLASPHHAGEAGAGLWRAQGYLVVIRHAAGGEKGAVDRHADPLPLTAPQVRRPLRHLVWARPPDQEAARAWSHWRRRQQQRSRQNHCK